MMLQRFGVPLLFVLVALFIVFGGKLRLYHSEGDNIINLGVHLGL